MEQGQPVALPPIRGGIPGLEPRCCARLEALGYDDHSCTYAAMNNGEEVYSQCDSPMVEKSPKCTTVIFHSSWRGVVS